MSFIKDDGAPIVLTAKERLLVLTSRWVERATGHGTMLSEYRNGKLVATTPQPRVKLDD